MSKRIYDLLRSHKFYKGKQEPKKISASQCGAPLLQLYLSQTCEVVDGPNSFSKATNGSIAHLGMEKLVIDEKMDNVEVEVDMQRMLPNGWKITGTSDLIDHEDRVVVDYKFEMNYAYKMHFKDGPDAPYNMQGACYSWLCCDDGPAGIVDLDYDFHIMSFITDHSPIKKDHPAEAIQVTHMPIYDNTTFGQKMLEKTNKLENHINMGLVPDECDDVWFRKVNGVTIKTRCAYYCKFSSVCPYYSTMSKTTARVASWG